VRLLALVIDDKFGSAESDYATAAEDGSGDIGTMDAFVWN
jgi:hypothetical protein